MKKYFKIISIIFFLSSTFVLMSCGAKQVNTGAKNSSYPSAVAWNNIIYGVSVSEVSKNELGKQIGEVKRNNMPMPIENGDANNTAVGSKIYDIKDTDSKDVIAIEKEGKLYKAFKNGPLK